MVLLHGEMSSVFVYMYTCCMFVWRCKSKGRDGEKFRLGVRKWEGDRESQEGRERGKRRERFTLMYTCCRFIHSEMDSWRTGAESLAAIHCIDCIYTCIVVVYIAQPSHMAILTVYCDLCT